jgi:hypothetical protein
MRRAAAALADMVHAALVQTGAQQQQQQRVVAHAADGAAWCVFFVCLRFGGRGDTLKIESLMPKPGY